MMLATSILVMSGASAFKCSRVLCKIAAAFSPACCCWSSNAFNTFCQNSSPSFFSCSVWRHRPAKYLPPKCGPANQSPPPWMCNFNLCPPPSS
ncbi:uncharacterized protein LACBIDRAFT_307346 [Laccaria bicolor S238N-H82]|uniref:Predicted protein n=1 Tax=Laccaria bicolor (strain S238N-H82 / ATCC MYA-4686) TaxID=486041 RepID=B0DPW9_LACBS|nr:uncharacterized protein LACBIDRAFT_307346 [Laccaria bicolor S238N-H82]EDR03189.1 predicted protein [Laccaria bicolor S238N-H82]|eukprot:XP_001885985.1 predicted protein [Laccaria bicolor S238N-H82]